MDLDMSKYMLVSPDAMWVTRIPVSEDTGLAFGTIEIRSTDDGALLSTLEIVLPPVLGDTP